MRIPGKEERLKFFQDLYENAKSKSQTNIDTLERHLKQYKGSKEIDGSIEEAKIVRNITYELIESQISSNIPTAKVTSAKANTKNYNLSRSIENMISSFKDREAFEALRRLTKQT